MPKYKENEKPKMKSVQTPFNKYQLNIYSQNGEDGILSEILQRLDLLDAGNWCVEFGAWDGKHLSNTFALVERKGFNAVYIEGDIKRFEDLLKTVSEHPQIVPVRAYVEPSRNSPDSLDQILSKTEIPQSFALLSIDIDSCDLDVWESLTNYQPIVVVIEINSSVLPGIVWRHSSKTPGNTFSATENVAKEKGYTLVCHTGNLIFVRNDKIANLNFDDRYIKYPELLFQFDSHWIRSPKKSNKIKALIRKLRSMFTK